MCSYRYWCFIGEIKDQQEEQKFRDLTMLAKAYLSLSHGNAAPERGFSLNKSVLQDREQMHEDTIIAIRMVKDAVLMYGKPENFPITRRLLDLCASSRKKYFLHLDVEKNQKELLAKQKQQENEKNEIRKKNTEKLSEIRKIESQIEEERLKLCVAEKLIEEGNESLSALLKLDGRLDKSSVMKSQIVINAGIDSAKKINSTIEGLKEKLKSMSTL